MEAIPRMREQRIRTNTGNIHKFITSQTRDKCDCNTDHHMKQSVIFSLNSA